MQRFFLLLALGLLAIGGFSYWYFQPERVLIRKAEKLLSLASVEGGQGVPARAGKTLSFVNHLADEVIMSSSFPQLDRSFTSGELETLFKFYINSVRSASFEIDEASVTMNSPSSGRVRFYATGTTDFGSGEEARDARGYLDFTKLDSGWKLSEALIEQAQ